MDLIQLVMFLIVVGVLLYVVQMIPMDATIKKIITILVVAVIILWVLSQLIGYAPHIQIGGKHG